MAATLQTGLAKCTYTSITHPLARALDLDAVLVLLLDAWL